jgi:hypothetical protein
MLRVTNSLYCYAESDKFFIVMLNVVMLSFVVLSVIMPSATAPFFKPQIISGLSAPS